MVDVEQLAWHLWPSFKVALTLLGLAVLAGLASTVAFLLMGGMKRRLILLTGLIGVPLHELSHAFTAILFGMRVEKISLFEPDPQSPQLGYVRFRYSPGRFIHRIGLFFVGISPLIAGSIATAWLLESAGGRPPPLDPLFSLKDVPQAFVATHHQLSKLLLESPWSSLMAFVAVCFALHSAPSLADLKQAGIGLASGLAVLLVFLLPLIVVAAEFGPDLGALRAGIQWLEFAIIQTTLVAVWSGLAVAAVISPFRLARWLVGSGTVREA